MTNLHYSGNNNNNNNNSNESNSNHNSLPGSRQRFEAAGYLSNTDIDTTGSHGSTESSTPINNNNNNNNNISSNVNHSNSSARRSSKLGNFTAMIMRRKSSTESEQHGHPASNDVVNGTQKSIESNESTSECRPNIGLKQRSISYLQHRSTKRYNLESTASDFETDERIQEEQCQKLKELQQSNSHSHSRKSSMENYDRESSKLYIGAFCCSRISHFFARLPTGIVSLIIFLVLASAGIAIGLVIGSAQSTQNEEEALALSLDTGKFFSEQLDKAILPLFSMAQFANHFEIFHRLPDQIGLAGTPGALPLNTTTWKRNITGVCDDPELIDTFVDIAENIKSRSGMDGILANIQLAPDGVICLLHPMNNTEDFEDGKFLDSTSVWGLDLFQDPAMKFIALQSIQSEDVGVAGPIQLKQCPDCDPFLIARLPVWDDSHEIVVEGVPYARWGFATAIIAWTALVEQSGVYETFEDSDFEFELTRTDNILNTETGRFEENVVVLASTPDYQKYDRWKRVSTSLETTNNEWVMCVSYNPAKTNLTVGLVIGSTVIVAFLISFLVYTVLIQKHDHADMLAKGSAQEARVATERNMTAYFAHELRNPLSALDSALSSIKPSDIPDHTKELLDAMQLCSSFMSSIMNNLLDARKIEEGKMRLRSKPLSLGKLVDDIRTMMKSAVRKEVELLVEKDLPPNRNWVLGDEHRIQQVLTNVITNAIKYTLKGSITLRVRWDSGFVVLECEDTGPGIPKSEQARMFERFVQRGGAPGTGLGLNISQQIVHMMGGTIGFESDPTVAPGTTCRVTLPLLASEEPDADFPSARKEVGVIEESIKVLIIDDIRMNRTMLSRRISKAVAPNAEVSTAETAEEALELCEETDFDVIICDQYMEEAGGVMVGTDGIIAMRRNKVGAYIIGCSGNDLDNEFYEAGADMVWGKPLPPNGEIIQQFRHGLQEKGRSAV